MSPSAVLSENGTLDLELIRRAAKVGAHPHACRLPSIWPRYLWRADKQLGSCWLVRVGSTLTRRTEHMQRNRKVEQIRLGAMGA